MINTEKSKKELGEFGNIEFGNMELGNLGGKIPTPDLSRMEKWITSSEIYDKSGGIHSWLLDGEKGYLYNEITGYGIKLYTYLYDIYKDQKYLDMAQKSVDYINIQTKNNEGGITRAGIFYVFDTSICLSGVLSYYNTIHTTRDSEQIRITSKNLLHFIYYNLLNKSPIILNGTLQKDLDFNHWSLSYGSHLLKCCVCLSQSSNIFQNEKRKIDKLVDRICSDMLHNYKDGHFNTNSNSEIVYTHSHCYATEGLMYLNKPEYLHIISESAEWLADIQNKDGSLYNWHFSNKIQEELTDITAQSIRIWLWTDKEKFKNNIERGFNFLKSMQSPEGGIYYRPGSRYVNSWSTIFTMNALLWYNNGVDTKWLI